MIPSKKRLALGAVVFLAGLGLGYWAVFTIMFLEDVLPHGGFW